MTVLSDVGDDKYFSTVLKIHFDAGIARFLGHRPRPLGFFTVQCVVWCIYRITLATCSIISAGRRITFLAVSTVAAKWNQIRMPYFQIEGRVD